MKLWEQYFAPHTLEESNSEKSVNIPVSWFNFITMMLMTPEKFDWARNFLMSPPWEIVCENNEHEHTFTFNIPDKCMPAHACKVAEISEGDTGKEDGGKEVLGFFPPFAQKGKEGARLLWWKQR